MGVSNSMDFSNSRLTINSKDASNSKEEKNGDVECINLTISFHSRRGTIVQHSLGYVVVGSHIFSSQIFFLYIWFFSGVENSTEPTGKMATGKNRMS